jgi:hypothetical protein
MPVGPNRVSPRAPVAKLMKELCSNFADAYASWKVFPDHEERPF